MSRAVGESLLGRAGPPLAAAYIRAARRLIRWRWEGREHMERVVAARRPVICAFWHGRLLLMAPVIQESALPVKVMISANRDGELIARTIARFGAETIRGSTRNRRKGERDKGGAAAARDAVAHLKAGGVLAITPDGPRGPRMRAHQGVALIAAQSGAPVLPAAFSVERGRFLKSWDRFLLAAPWGRGAYVFGAPLDPPPDAERASLEAHRQAVESALTAVARRADALCGRATPAPADHPPGARP